MMSNLLSLPIDILINILKKLKISELRNVMLTCKAFRNLIVNDNTIWRSVCRDRLILNIPRDSGSPELSLFNRCRISQNWCNGYYRSKEVIHHYINYMPWLIFHNSEALVLSVGSELYCYPTYKNGLPNSRNILWTLDVPKLKRNDVRTNDISRFVIKNNLLACGNRDGCVAVYQLHDIYTKPHLISHIKDCHQGGQLEVSAVELIRTPCGTTVVTGSNYSPNLMLYHIMMDDEENANELSTTKNYFNIATHLPAYEDTGIRSLSANLGMDKLAIGLNGNSKPLLLDVNNNELLMKSAATRDAKQEVRDIQWHTENTITYVTHSGMLQMIDIRSNEVVYNVRDPFLSTLYCVKSDGEHAIMVGSAEYSRCVLFDTRNQVHHVQMYFTRKRTSPVYSLHFDATKLITAVDRGVTVLNFNIDPKTVEQRDYSDVFF